MDEIDKSDQARSSDKTPSAIALILVITLSAISGVVVILLAIAVALDKVSFSEAKDMLSLILVTLGTLTGAAVGFYFGFNQGKNFQE